MKKLNLKKTWWILLLMFLQVFILCILFGGFDFVIYHQSDLPSSFDFINSVTGSGYTYYEMIFVMYVSSFMFCFLTLNVLLWLLLWKLFDKHKIK